MQDPADCRDVSKMNQVDDLSEYQSEAESDCSSSNVDDGDDGPRFPSFESIKTSKKFWSSIDGEYTDWGPREAFRELIQNWRDAIIESNNLAVKDFYVQREAKGEANGEATPPKGDTEIVYKAFRRGVKDSPECLGFVRYKGRKGQGTVEITNLRAALQTKHLRLGTTNKKQREDQAGAHGEGLKVAAIALMRGAQNHRLSGRSTGFNLSFNFDADGSLCVFANRINLNRTQQRKKFVFPTPAVNANGDVQFIIGERQQGRNEFGEKVQRSPVEQQHFKDWTKVALFLTEVEGGDASIISTVYGDLLISADQRGKVYLKGLLVSESTQYHSAIVTRRPLAFGYNFASGRTDRDRRSLVDDESEAMCKILSEALTIRPDLAGKVCDLLNSAHDRYAEGQCSALSWPSRTALLFKEHLLRGEFANRWLYSSGEMRKNLVLLRIIKGMGRQPFPLSQKLWEILNYHSLVSSAEKEAQRCYKNAPTVPSPETTFATSVDRLLQACMRACPQTISMRVEFVDAGRTHLDFFLLEKTWSVRIHKRWLSIDTAVAKLGLFGNVVEARAAVFAARKLFSDVVRSVPIEKFLQQDSMELPEDQREQQVRRAEQRLENYQMMHIGIVGTTHKDHLGLTVAWTVNDGQQGDVPNIEVQCHRVSHCSHLRDQLSLAADVEAKKMACITQNPGSMQPRELDAPPCRVHRTNLRRGTLCESGLEEGEEYFFVLATPADPHSLVRVSGTKRVVARAEVPANRLPPKHRLPLKRNHDDDSFALGSRVEAHELLEQALASDRWYNAENSHRLRAVIGFVKGEQSHPAESRKRPRTN